ncbi:MAG: hypothetical protein E7329_06030 [Clostridiales bacterium]|nr:hypothetical protein [Clostridiales bacterium]
MTTRIITGVCLTLMLAGVLAIDGWLFSVLYMVSICFSMYEVFRALRQAGHRPPQWPAWLCLALSIPLFEMGGSMPVLLTLVAGACMLISAMVLFRAEPKLEDILISCMPLVCVLMPGMCMLGIQNAPTRGQQLLLTILAFGVPLAGDTVAYFVGSRFGVRKLCPAVSPNKSLEGAVAGLVGSVVFSMALFGIFSIFMPMPRFWHCLVLGLLGGLAGQLGDLFASLIKRHCGIKDYSSIFPGHGGMMDRLDSVYWATVIMYVYLNLSPFPV